MGEVGVAKRWGITSVASIALVCCVPGLAFAAGHSIVAGLASNGVGSEFELTFWQSVKDSEDKGQLEAYLSQYPNGTFAALARAKIATINKREASPGSPVVQPAPVVAKPVAVIPPAPVAAPVSVLPPLPVAVAAPASVAAPVLAPVVPPPVPVAAPAPVIVPAVVAVVPPAAPVAPAASGPSFADQLRLLSQSQRQSNEPAPLSVKGELPPRPVLEGGGEFSLPASFCSANERNAYYDSAYKPAMDVADRNNQAAIGHLEKLQKLFDAHGARNETVAMNLMANEAKAYKEVANAVFERRSAFDAAFNLLMAVPVVKCEKGK